MTSKEKEDIKINFLISSERSGTNLLRCLLDAHSEVYAPNTMLLGQLWLKLTEYGDLRHENNWKVLLQEVCRRYDCSSFYSDSQSKNSSRRR